MIFEDDADLHDDFRGILTASMQHLPANWDMLYFGGSHRETPVPAYPGLLRVSKTLTTHGYLIRSSMFDQVIDTFRQLQEPVDCLYVQWQPSRQVFITDPPIAWQRGGYSDICQRAMNYPWIRSNRQ